jgi:ABC-type dipeptide/oligopeptide/nickel transport system permease subunit
MTIAGAAEYLPEAYLPPRRRFDTLRKVLRKKISICALVYLAIFYGLGIFAPVVATDDPTAQHRTLSEVRQGPSAEHWFGTDALGRDLYSRVVYSARTTIIFTLVVLLTGGLFLGLGLGLLAGYRGGWTDTAIMRIGEVLAGLPTLILMLAITAAFRPRITSLSYWLEDHTFLGQDAPTLVKFVIITAATVPFAWVGSCRIVRSQVLTIRELSFVTAAESMGASTGRILWRHILPGVLPLFIVGLSSSMAGIAGAEVALSYIGLGIDPPASSFGSLIYEAGGSATLQDYPHLLIFSAGPVILFFFAWNLLGDALVDILEPRSERRS